MTPLLQQAVAALTALPPADQDAMAARLLDEMAAEEAFDRAIESSSGKLALLVAEAVAEDQAGQTLPLNPDDL